MTSMGKRYGTHSIDYQFYHYLKTGMKEKACVFEMLQCANLGSFYSYSDKLRHNS